MLVDLGEPTVRFLVTPPGVFFPDYEIALDDATVAALDIATADEVLLLVIVSLRDGAPTANLLGPATQGPLVAA